MHLIENQNAKNCIAFWANIFYIKIFITKYLTISDKNWKRRTCQSSITLPRGSFGFSTSNSFFPGHSNRKAKRLSAKFPRNKIAVALHSRARYSQAMELCSVGAALSLDQYCCCWLKTTKIYCWCLVMVWHWHCNHSRYSRMKKWTPENRRRSEVSASK